MFLDIEDFNGNRLCALLINPYDENKMSPTIENSIGNISLCDAYDFDDIFANRAYHHCRVCV